MLGKHMQKHEVRICSGFNATSSISLRHFDTWFLAVCTVWKNMCGVTLLGEVSLGMHGEISKATRHSLTALSASYLQSEM